MPLDLPVPQLQADLARTKARWTATVTSLSELSEEEKKLRLGAVPPPGAPSLSEREANAAANLKKPAGAAVSFPSSFDWRNSAGQNYVTPVRDQSSCGSCVSFGSIAAVEAKCRISSHDSALGIDLSEAQLFYCDARSEGRRCSGPSGGWWPDRALIWLKTPGVADEACYPYTAGDQNCTNLCPDWRSRVTSITVSHSISNRTEMKQWISTGGPLLTCFSVYDDFFSYSSGVYHHVTGNLAGGHCVCVVG